MPINFKAKAIAIVIVLLNNHTFLDPFFVFGPTGPQSHRVANCKMISKFWVVVMLQIPGSFS